MDKRQAEDSISDELDKNGFVVNSEVSMLPRRCKVRSTVPNEGVDLAIGKGELEGAEPITFCQLFQQRVQEFPNVAALKWKEKEGEGEESKMVWKTATYAEYYKSSFDAAKSLLKASIYTLINYI